MSMIQDSRTLVYMRSKPLFYIIPFVSFVAAVMLHETITTKLVAKYVSTAWAQPYIGYVLIYILAIHLLPAVGYVIAKQVMD